MLDRPVFSFLAQVLPTLKPHHEVNYIHRVAVGRTGRREAVHGTGFRVDPQRWRAVGVEGAAQHVVCVRLVAVERQDAQDREPGFEDGEGHLEKFEEISLARISDKIKQKVTTTQHP